MNKISSRAIWLAMVAAAMAGCGGNGGHNNDSDGTNPFAGVYTGEFSTDTERYGRVNVTISESGEFTGNAVPANDTETGEFHLRVDNDGSITGYIRSTEDNSNTNYEGELYRDNSGTINGTVAPVGNEEGARITFIFNGSQS